MNLVHRYLLFFFMFILAGNLQAQDSTVFQTEILSSNVDSLIQDSLRKAFILNHKPLKAEQLQAYKIQLSDGVYGQYATSYIRHSDVYMIKMKPKRLLIIEHETPHREWIFYSFVLLLFLSAVVNAFYPAYFSRLTKIFLNPVMVFGQAREPAMQDPVPAVFYQILFFFAAALFMYFGFAVRLKLAEIHWTRLVFGAAIGFFVIYACKHLILLFLGWLFKQKEVFENYSFLVTLINKISGVVLLTFSLLLAYATEGSLTVYFRMALILMSILLMLRLFRGYQIFKKQTKTSVFTYIMAFVSLELLPTCVLLKFIMDQLVLRKIDLL